MGDETRAIGEGFGAKIIDLRGKLPTARPQYQHFREVGQIAKIAVHFDDQVRPAKYSPVPRYVGQANYHINKVWGYTPGGQPIRGFGLMYAYKIAGDGQWYQTQDEGLITWSVRNANPFTLSICFDCGEMQQPTEAQVRSLHEGLMWLCYHRPEFPAGRKDVWGHGELTRWGNDTHCPGPFLSYVQKFRKGEW